MNNTVEEPMMPMIEVENCPNETEELESEELEKMSLLELMEDIADEAAYSKLSDEFFEEINNKADFLGKKLGLTPKQAVLYSIFIDNYDRQIGERDIREKTDARMTRLAQLQDDIDAIEKKRYIRSTHSFNKTSYVVPLESIKALRENKPYVPSVQKNLSFRALISEIYNLISKQFDASIPYEMLVEDLWDLIQNNMHLKICQKLSEWKNKTSPCNWLVLVTLCAYKPKNEILPVSNFKKLLYSDEDYYAECEMSWSFENETNELLKNGVVEFYCSDGMQDKELITLSRKGVKTFLSEYKHKNDEGMSKLRDHSKITVKKLFFDEEVRVQVDRLGDLLSPKSFKNICNQLKLHGMRQGFACLFYGAPGTGKTETVLQLAKKTGRNIMQVDFSEIKDKFVGESEKNIKAVFDNYREAVKEEKRCPILLFNEADAIIGKRLENVEHSVDQMNNAIQNIILQEMENFEGILIATTNLEGNMDPAFERRFLYKVRYEKPSAEVRKQIWMSIIPSLSEIMAYSLAKEFSFSGGQIENIARKQLIDSILYGESTNVYAALKAYCESESIQNRRARPCIGFAC